MAKINKDDPRQGRGYHGDSIYNPNFDDVPTVKDKGSMQQEAEDKKLREMDKRPNLGRMFKSGGFVRKADGCVTRGHTRAKQVVMK